ncbi:MFS transporter [Acidisoma cellulosilytica]|uniref:MFS transporter n=1 Tax=Acidisoma cellulosilyticum TaxID=2802395 RepID=A0A963Z2B1_9PROT|nr:MFS transporter [Acidisoma cellulosilyticum]MCB8881216.1 MFS transporter [Acidisoma cellulosilyticum]
MLLSLPAPSRFRWWIVLLLFVITVFNYIDRSAIAYAVPAISAQFHLAPSAMGVILGAFGLGYFVTTLIGGVAIDRWGTRIVLLIAALVWSIAIGSTAFAVGSLSLLAARAGLGLAEGPNFSAMSKALAEWLPARERATAMACVLVAVPAALALGGPLLTAILGVAGWRLMFGILSLLVLVWIPFWLWLFRDSPAASPYVNAAEGRVISGNDTAKRTPDHAFRWRDIGLVLANRTLAANTFAFFVFGYSLFFFMNWLPTFLENHYHLSIHNVGLFSFLPWSFAAVLLFACGPFSDFLLRKTGSLRIARSYLLIISQLGAALAVIPVVLSGNSTVAILFISLAVGLNMSTNAVYFAAGVDVARRQAGTALGIMDAGLAVAAFVAPSLTGYVVSLTGSFSAAFWLLGALSLSSAIIVAVFHRPDTDRLAEV